MTLRVTLEIVPYGVEEDKYEIGRLDIHNGKSYGLGLCEYYGSYMKDTEPTMTEFTNVLHSRQSGALILLRKVLEKLEQQDTSDHS